MPKKRLPENRGLPKRWCYKNGAYRYRVPPGLEYLWDGKQIFTLGKTLSEAHKEFALRMESSKTAKTIRDLIDRYQIEVIPTKSVKTQRDNLKQAERLRAVFGKKEIHDIEPQEIYQYYDRRDAKVAAKREIALLSHIYTKAVEWGYLKKHPFKGEVRIAGETPRGRYIKDWELAECFSLKKKPGCNTELIQAFIAFEVVAGTRKQDALTIKIEDLKDDGIHIHTKKRGKPIIIEWTRALRIVTQQLLDLRSVDISPYLICTRRGLSYYNDEKRSCSGFDSIFRRFMDRCLDETELEERFTVHDLRAKCASDIKDEEDAMKLLAHSNVNITRRSYRRAPVKVLPGR